MPRRARRDIFADAKVILCRWHSDIIFAVYTREANITRQRRISLHSNTSRRKANITEKAIVKCNRFFMARPKGFEPPFFRIGICCVIQLRHGQIFCGLIITVRIYIFIFRNRQDCFSASAMCPRTFLLYRI